MPPPPPIGRPSRRGGSAWKGRTEIDLPPWNEPSNDSLADVASSTVARVTNPNPRGRPVARSFGRLTSTTLPPVASKSCRRTSSVMESGNPATNNLRESSAIEKPAKTIDFQFYPAPRQKGGAWSPSGGLRREHDI